MGANPTTFVAPPPPEMTKASAAMKACVTRNEKTDFIRKRKGRGDCSSFGFVWQSLEGIVCHLFIPEESDLWGQMCSQASEIPDVPHGAGCSTQQRAGERQVARDVQAWLTYVTHPDLSINSPAKHDEVTA